MALSSRNRQQVFRVSGPDESKSVDCSASSTVFGRVACSGRRRYAFGHHYGSFRGGPRRQGHRQERGYRPIDGRPNRRFRFLHDVQPSPGRLRSHCVRGGLPPAIGPSDTRGRSPPEGGPFPSGHWGAFTRGSRFHFRREPGKYGGTVAAEPASHMLKVHQRLGLITAAPMLATILTAPGGGGPARHRLRPRPPRHARRGDGRNVFYQRRLFALRTEDSGDYTPWADPAAQVLGLDPWPGNDPYTGIGRYGLRAAKQGRESAWDRIRPRGCRNHRHCLWAGDSGGVGPILSVMNRFLWRALLACARFRWGSWPTANGFSNSPRSPITCRTRCMRSMASATRLAVREFAPPANAIS